MIFCKNRILLSVLLLCGLQVFSQDTLPKFSVRNVGANRIVIGWVNSYPQVSSISIQRSFDSLTAYKTILSVADPSALQNGFVDTKAQNDHMFYRLFFVFEGGRYQFTAAKRPLLDYTPSSLPSAGAPSPSDTVAVVIKRPDYVPSVFVYTNADGHVFINLPDADQKKYRIRFLLPDNEQLFELKTIRDAALTVDKSNFLNAGWYFFELYDGEKLVEKNKFYLTNDF